MMTLEQVVAHMRELGVDEVEYFNEDGGIRRVRLNPYWRPPEKAEEPPIFDPNPEANALAQREWLKKQAIRLELEKQAAEDAVRFAATDGVP